jgi:hypothetical protein
MCCDDHQVRAKTQKILLHKYLTDECDYHPLVRQHLGGSIVSWSVHLECAKWTIRR